MKLKSIYSSARALALLLAAAGVAQAFAADPAPNTAAAAADHAWLQIASGPFKATTESLRTFQPPEWFRDAKFGIWSHWGPQAVPRQGDWYARHMYLQGHRHYEHHLKTWGHPSKHGYKDIIPLWKAEKWDPDALMALYAKAGAKYFVSMGVHHDNFDLWNSKHHRWNSVKMGPMRDIVGEWKQAAVKYGLRFGVSEHLGASYSWWSPNKAWDQYGPTPGVRYDGADPANQDLYHPEHNEPFRWGRSWYATNPEWHRRWFDRIKDVVDQYQPDLLYTDGGIPFENVGRSMVAHLYNSSAARNGGKVDAIYTHKDMGTGEFIREAGAQDVERGVMQGINPLVWQTDTSIGDWFYSEGFKYKSTSETIHMLADIVSKNGCMLLNVVQYPDGSLPPEAMTFLHEMAAWMAVNAEAIHGTRPWKVFGEGPTMPVPGHFKEDTAYTARDVRFTTKAGTVYAIVLGLPTGELKIAALGSGAGHAEKPVKSVRVLGSDASLKWSQTGEALVVQMPGAWPTQHAAVLKVEF